MPPTEPYRRGARGIRRGRPAISHAVAPKTEQTTMIRSQSRLVRVRTAQGGEVAASMTHGTTIPIVTRANSTQASTMPGSLAAVWRVRDELRQSATVVLADHNSPLADGAD